MATVNSADRPKLTLKTMKLTIGDQAKKIAIFSPNSVSPASLLSAIRGDQGTAVGFQLFNGDQMIQLADLPVFLYMSPPELADAFGNQYDDPAKMLTLKVVLTHARQKPGRKPAVDGSSVILTEGSQDVSIEQAIPAPRARDLPADVAAKMHSLARKFMAQKAKGTYVLVGEGPDEFYTHARDAIVKYIVKKTGYKFSEAQVAEKLHA